MSESLAAGGGAARPPAQLRPAVPDPAGSFSSPPASSGCWTASGNSSRSCSARVSRGAVRRRPGRRPAHRPGVLARRLAGPGVPRRAARRPRAARHRRHDRPDGTGNPPGWPGSTPAPPPPRVTWPRVRRPLQHRAGHHHGLHADHDGLAGPGPYPLVGKSDVNVHGVLPGDREASWENWPRYTCHRSAARRWGPS